MEDAQKALAKGDYNAAIQHFTSILLSPPTDFSNSAQSLVLWSRSTCYFNIEDHGRASEDALQILDLPETIVEQELVPNVYSIHAAAAFRLASANAKLGLSGKAMAYSRMFQSLKKNTTPAAEGLERAEALKKQGNQLFGQGKIQEAMAKYMESLAIHYKNEALLGNLSLAFLLLNDHKSALDYADKAIKLNPSWSKGWYRQGKVHMVKERFADAVASFSRGLREEPDNQELKRALSEAKYLRARLGDRDPGFNSHTTGMLMTIQHDSWVSVIGPLQNASPANLLPKDVKSWIKNAKKPHYMTLEALDALLGEYLESMDVMRDIETIIQSRYPHYKRFMSPLSLNESMKSLVSESGNESKLLPYLFPYDPILSGGILLTLLKKALPTTVYSVVFSFDVNGDSFEESELVPYIKEHGQYAALVSTEGDGTVIDFLALWTMAIYPLSKRKFYFQDVAYEKAVYENGLTYTIDDKGEYVDLVEGIYSRERTKALALEHLKESSFAIKQRPSTASTDSLETLTNEPAPIDSAKTCNIQTSFLETSPLDKLREEEALLQKQESLLEKDMYDILSKAEKLASQANTDLTNGRDDGMEIYRYIKLAIIGLSFVVGFFAWTQYSVVQMEGNYSA